MSRLQLIKMANFVVQQRSLQDLTQEDIDTLMKWTSDEGWDPPHIRHMYVGPPYLDAKVFFGFLDGKRIGHVVFFTYGKEGNSSDLMDYITFFLVEKSFRGKGYGLKIWNAMWECRDASANTCLDSVDEMISRYEMLGLNIEWDNREYAIPLSAIAEKYKVTENIRNVSTKLLSEVEFEKYAEYDAKVYGLCRLAFLKKWTSIPESITWVAMSENGDVVGCITVRELEFADKQDAIVGPLYADNLEIAKKLMYTVSQMQKFSRNLRMLIPTGISNAIQMVESDFGVKYDCNFSRMCRRKSNVDLSKVIAIHSQGYG